MSFRLTEIPKRIGIYYKCMTSEPGQEPKDEHLVDPEDQKPKLKPLVRAQLIYKHRLEQQQAELAKLRAQQEAGAPTGDATPANTREKQ